MDQATTQGKSLQSSLSAWFRASDSFDLDRQVINCRCFDLTVVAVEDRTRWVCLMRSFQEMPGQAGLFRRRLPLRDGRYPKKATSNPASCRDRADMGVIEKCQPRVAKRDVEVNCLLVSISCCVSSAPTACRYILSTLASDDIRNRRQTGRSHRANGISTMARTAQAGSPPRQSGRQALHDDHMPGGSRLERFLVFESHVRSRRVVLFHPPRKSFQGFGIRSASIHPSPLLRNHFSREDGQQSGRGLA